MISQWCATPSYPVVELSTDDSEEVEYELPGHTMCRAQRWHDPARSDRGHWSAMERESQDCTCACHTTNPRT